jgi:glycosyltransferase involved in cell wall biosynthesis
LKHVVDCDRDETAASGLPRLLYLADVPVEASYHGSVILFRLLQNYPRDMLLVLESGMFGSAGAQRLENVRYAVMGVGKERFLRTRFANWYSFWLTLSATEQSGRIGRNLDTFGPEAVLTVAHGYSWLTAAKYAQANDLPLHLVVHDDWPEVTPTPQGTRGLLHRQFAKVYRQARSRLCVSPFMVDEYRSRYGASGAVLFPSRAIDAVCFRNPPDPEVDREARPFTLAYAGSLYIGGYVEALRHAAEALKLIGGQLLIYGPTNKDDLGRFGLTQGNVQCLGFVPTSNELILDLRKRADALYLPMSFKPWDLGAMRLNLPSKLADYTIAGLPILIRGPAASSAVLWGRRNPGVAELVEREDVDSLYIAIKRLAEDPSYRSRLGQRAIEIGQECFSNAAARAVFYRSLRGGASQESSR